MTNNHNNNYIKLLHWNSNSLQQKIQELYYFLNSNKIDIACISETYLKHNTKIDLHPRYTLYRKDRIQSKRGGGVAILILNSIKHNLLPDLNLKLIECIGVAVYMDNGKKLLFFSIYLPGSAKSAEIKEHFLNDIRKITNTFRHSTYYIAGDFNAKHRSWLCLKGNLVGKLLYEESMDEGFTILHSLTPTHIPDDHNRAPSTIDLIITNSTSYIETPLCTYLGSNHNAVKTKINISDKIITNLQKKHYLYSKTNWSYYQKEFDKQINSTPHLETIENSSQIDELILTFTKATKYAREKAVPQVFSNKREFIQLTPSIHKMIIDRSFLRRAYQRTRDPSLKYYINGFSKQIRREIDRIRNENWKKTLETLPKNDNNKRLWTLTKTMLKRDKIVPPLKIDNNVLLTPSEKAEALAENFIVNHTNPFDNQITSFSTEIKQQNTLLLSNDAESPEYPETNEIIYYVKLSKNSTAPGYDEVKTILLKKLSASGFNFLTLIICACLKLCYFPNSWKHAIVTPIKKPGKDGQCVSSYRPISLLSNISKILEKIILARLRNFADDNDIIPETQHGFRKKRSTITQLTHVNSLIKSNLNNQITTGLLILDIEKAFDRVWHDGLVYKMSRFNFPKYLIKIIASFISQRSFQVSLSGAKSSRRSIFYGCPQGAVLSPFLYSIYIADAPSPNNCTVAFYADDTAIICNENKWTDTEECLRKAVNEFFAFYEKWRININVEKTKAVLITKRLVKELPSSPFHVLNAQIEWTNEAKYLGVILDRRLTYRKHVDFVLQKAQMAIRLLYPLMCRKAKLDKNNKILLYKSCIRPIFTYAAPLMTQLANSNIAILQRFQNRVLKMIMDLPFWTNTQTLHDICNVEFVSDFIARLHENFRNNL